MSQITALLLDRDGTIIKDKHYLADPDGVELLPGVVEALTWCAGRGMRFFLVSNQSGIGRGMFTSKEADAVNARMAQMLEPHGIRFSDMVYCPHAPEENCNCRKPGIGMWEKLSARHSLRADECLMIGDKEEDMRFATNAGLLLRALVLTGKGEATAQRLHLPYPETPENTPSAGPHCTHLPQSASHPNIILPSFFSLPEALARLSKKVEPCGV